MLNMANEWPKGLGGSRFFVRPITIYFQAYFQVEERWETWIWYNN